MKIHLIFFTIFFVACNQSPEVDNFQISGSGEYISLTTKSSINPKSKYIQYYENGEKSCLFYGNAELNELIIYHFPSGKIENRITFNKRGPDGIGAFRGMLVHSFDTIFLVSATYYNNFFLIDSTGRIKQKYALQPIANNQLPPAIRPLSIHLSNQGVYHHGRINLSTYLFSPSSVKNENLYDEIIDFEYDLGKRMVTDFANYPLFDNKYKAQLYGCSRTYNGTQFIYSFHKMDAIHVQNKEGNYYTEYFCGSRYRNMSLDWSVNRRSSIFEQRKSSNENPQYFSIVYDKYHEVYYRFFKPGQNLAKNEDVIKYADYPKLFSIILLDKNFNLIGETLLPEKTYDPYMKFIGKDGLYMALHIDHPMYNPDSLKFERMELVRK